MLRKLAFGLVLLGVVQFELPRAFADASMSPAQAPEEEPERLLEYVERTSGGADPASPLPLLIIVHGLGDRPENFIPVFETLPIKARLIAPRGPDSAGEGGSWYPIDDVTQDTAAILERTERLVALIEHITRTRPTLGKPVVTGFSQGGVMSLALAAYHADKLAGAVPMAGSLPPFLPRPNRPPSSFRVHAFHGETDTIVPYPEGVRTVRWLRKGGVKVTMVSYPGVGHALTPEMREQAREVVLKLLQTAQRAGRATVPHPR